MSPPKYVDLLLLAAALAVFLLGGLPLLGYAVGAAAWLAQRGIQMVAAQRAQAELAAGNRQKAMGIVAATTLGRVWLMATAVLLVGLAEREAGPRRRGPRPRPLHRLLRRPGPRPPLRRSPRGRESHERRADRHRGPRRKSGLSTKAKVFIGLGVYLGDRDPDVADLRQLRQKRSTSSRRTSSSSNRGSRSTSPASTSASTRRSSTCSSPAP